MKATDTVLRELVESLSYKPGWEFALDGLPAYFGDPMAVPFHTSYMPTYLRVRVRVENSEQPGQIIPIEHRLKVPDIFLMGEHEPRALRRWLLQAILQIETHEACEFFQLGDERPFFPAHEPSEGDPYVIRERDAA